MKNCVLGKKRGITGRNIIVVFSAVFIITVIVLPFVRKMTIEADDSMIEQEFNYIAKSAELGVEEFLANYDFHALNTQGVSELGNRYGTYSMSILRDDYEKEPFYLTTLTENQDVQRQLYLSLNEYVLKYIPEEVMLGETAIVPVMNVVEKYGIDSLQQLKKVGISRNFSVLNEGEYNINIFINHNPLQNTHDVDDIAYVIVIMDSEFNYMIYTGDNTYVSSDTSLGTVVNILTENDIDVATYGENGLLGSYCLEQYNNKSN
ncbi:MAG: hypothetical protein ACK5LV_07070 [Lachnospirales bacterium]